MPIDANSYDYSKDKLPFNCRFVIITPKIVATRCDFFNPSCLGKQMGSLPRSSSSGFRIQIQDVTTSRGIRAFMESHLQAFKENNPQLEVVTELNRGQHPFLKGSYSTTFSHFYKKYTLFTNI
ncbi:unnamed protein product [Lactuca saligna]|uniref:Large ribosomal subunit protein mL43 n=1 Tax=Lactuca saligna TaxID=75948 RepID=A0AA35ZCG3_LACSI|nr:unnamed protein product [Lactuca saligna]